MNNVLSLVMESTWQTLVMVFFSGLFSMLIGLPLGILLYTTGSEEQGGITPRPLLNNILGRIVNVFRSFPFLILMILLLPFSRFIIGKTRIYAIIPLHRCT